MTTGAAIFFVVCGARFDRKGRPADSPVSGEWFCSRHFERMRRGYQVTAEWIWANEEPARHEAPS